MSISDIEDAMKDAVVARGCFIVDVKISRNDEIELTVESETGSVTLEDCVALSEEFGRKFDKDEHDYELTVTSAGLDQPFKVLKQYVKAVGTQVDVSLKGGRRFQALLAAADGDGVRVEYQASEAVEGSKKKVKTTRSETLTYAQITGMRPHIEF